MLFQEVGFRAKSFYVDEYEQSGSNDLFWDIATSRLGIGTALPGYELEVIGIGLR